MMKEIYLEQSFQITKYLLSHKTLELATKNFSDVGDIKIVFEGVSYIDCPIILNEGFGLKKGILADYPEIAEKAKIDISSNRDNIFIIEYNSNMHYIIAYRYIISTITKLWSVN